MTERQIHDLAFHKRNKDGEIVIPDPAGQDDEPEHEPTMEEQLAMIDRLELSMGGNLKGVEEARAKVRAKHGQHQ